MSETYNFTIDGKEITGQPGQTILQAADAAGVYIPRLCAHKELCAHGSCRVCTVMVNGRPQAACTQPAGAGMVVENEIPKLLGMRKQIIDMLFVEGNHYCMFCEKSGNCELQGLAYRFGIMAPQHPYMFQKKELDASHPDIFIDQNRCIVCARCVRASTDVDGKTAFGFTGRGIHKKIAFNAEENLSQTKLASTDLAAGICPVGAIIKKRVGFAIPVGERKYDTKPIGSDIEKR